MSFLHVCQLAVLMTLVSVDASMCEDGVAMQQQATVICKKLPQREQLPGVLVLGSGGLIGRHLTNYLRAEGFRVLEVTNRSHCDLRYSANLAELDVSDIHFVFFLAFEVGGAKFLESASAQETIIQNNMQIFQTVFPWLKELQVPFVFTSSSQYLEGTAYGVLKRLGEVWTQQAPMGKVVRLWNVFGCEESGPKAHITGDWMASCSSSGEVWALTDGRERRQFTFVGDVVRFLTTTMLQWERTPPIADFSSRVWTTVREFGAILTSVAPWPCTIHFSNKEAARSGSTSPVDGLEEVAHMWPTSKLTSLDAALRLTWATCDTHSR